MISTNKAFIRMSAASTSSDDQYEFDFILGEGLQTSAQQASNTRRNRCVITLPDSSKAATMLTSSAVASPSDFDDVLDDEESDNEEMFEFEGQDSERTEFSMQELDRIEGVDRQDTMKYSLEKTKGVGRRGYPSLNQLLADQDYLGLLWKWAIPASCGVIGVAATAKYGADAYNARCEKMFMEYANEMVYHDGDFEEMKMCHNDWKRKLIVIGPKSKKMMASFLEVYVKKKPVSPQAISSLSYVFSIYKLTEQQAAKILYELAKKLEKKPASAGKLLFFGTRILKSPEAKNELQPIRDMLASSYRVGGEMFVANSQKTMGEAAYKSAVAAAGKGQTALTPGWEVLGLDKEMAQQIFDEVKNDGFLTGAQKLYGGLNEHKFDGKGRKVDDKGDVLKPDEADKEDDEDTPSGAVYECSECGYTMFPAKGREFKFMPDDFKCPECGATKDKFVDLSKMDK